jgi:hypothetical protein
MKELQYDPKHVLPHRSYLINLGKPNEWVSTPFCTVFFLCYPNPRWALETNVSSRPPHSQMSERPGGSSTPTSSASSCPSLCSSLHPIECHADSHRVSQAPLSALHPATRVSSSSPSVSMRRIRRRWGSLQCWRIWCVPSSSPSSPALPYVLLSRVVSPCVPKRQY